MEALTGLDQQNCMLVSVVQGQSPFLHQAQKVSIDQGLVISNVVLEARPGSTD